MNVLVIGGGGREHALAWKLAQSPRVAKVFVAPGNAGTAREPGLTNVAITAIAELVAFAQAAADRAHRGRPGSAARRRRRRRVPRARACASSARRAPRRSSRAPRISPRRSWCATASRPRATRPSPMPPRRTRYVDARGAPIVVKADGLAAGKGVVVATTADEAHAAIDAMLVGNAHGRRRRARRDRGVPRRRGGELHRHGRRPQRAAARHRQDHKRLRDGDRGPNTGGMGAYSPAPVVTPALHARIMREVILPTVAGMAADGMPYTGFLYAGLMIDAAGKPKVLEFNCRLGDPETQPILMRLKSDLLDLLEHARRRHARHGRGGVGPPRGARRGAGRRAAIPTTPRKGDAITRPADSRERRTCHVFHAGTALADGKVVTDRRPRAVRHRARRHR